LSGRPITGLIFKGSGTKDFGLGDTFGTSTVDTFGTSTVDTFGTSTVDTFGTSTVDTFGTSASKESK
jgi:hypothetical protein